MRTGGLGEILDCGHEDWRIRRKFGLWALGLEDRGSGLSRGETFYNGQETP